MIATACPRVLALAVPECTALFRALAAFKDVEWLVFFTGPVFAAHVSGDIIANATAPQAHTFPIGDTLELLRFL